MRRNYFKITGVYQFGSKVKPERFESGIDIMKKF